MLTVSSPWAQGELTVSTVVTAPGPNDHSSVTTRRGHGEVTAQSRQSHSSVTARPQLNHGIFSMITAQSRLGHSSITAQVTAQSRLAVTILVAVSSRWSVTVSSHGGQSRWSVTVSSHGEVTVSSHGGQSRWAVTVSSHGGQSRWAVTVSSHGGQFFSHGLTPPIVAPSLHPLVIFNFYTKSLCIKQGAHKPFRFPAPFAPVKDYMNLCMYVCINFL